MTGRRAAELGDAWHPFFAPAAVTATARTVSLAEEEDIDAALAYLRVGRIFAMEQYLTAVRRLQPGVARNFLVRFSGRRRCVRRGLAATLLRARCAVA